VFFTVRPLVERLLDENPEGLEHLRKLSKNLPQTATSYENLGKQFILNRDQQWANPSLARMNPFLRSLYQKAFSEGFPRSIPRTVKFKRKLDRHTLIVVHPIAGYDLHGVSKSAIDAVVRKFKAQKRPVIYLLSDDGEQDIETFLEDRHPTYATFSAYGEHNLPIESDEITLVGGYFNQCLGHALKDAISRHDLYSKGALTAHFHTNAIYESRSDQEGKSLILHQTISAFEREKRKEEFLRLIAISILLPDPKSLRPADSGQLEITGFPYFDWQGSVSTKDHKVELYLDGELIDTVGKGKLIRLMFWQDKQP
ncbi:MAG: hypothetical protein AB1540_06200, partial [Bdellovibrionota bacterium]